MVLFGSPITAIDYTIDQVKMKINKFSGEPYTINADIQPETDEDGGEKFEITAQGRQDSGYVKVYTDTKLNISKEGKLLTGTLLNWEGEKWEVIKELPYTKNSFFILIQHYKYIAQLRTLEEIANG